MRRGRRKPKSVQFFRFKKESIAFLVAVVQEYFFKRRNAQIRHAHRSEGHVVVFNVRFLGNNALIEQCLRDFFYVGNSLSIAAQQAVHNGCEGGVGFGGCHGFGCFDNLMRINLVKLRANFRSTPLGSYLYSSVNFLQRYDPSGVEQSAARSYKTQSI